ncbi:MULTISPECIES: hypothetical protein [unclassified Streptomyces]|uniref:hypothetical protein n=1 Tax=unclassified Streptomyces TaxID=2593676 RepID=UPI003D93A0D3
MTTSATLPRVLDAAQAVALSLLQDGFSASDISLLTGVTDELYDLATEHGITAPCGGVEGHECHEARGESPCPGCTLAFGSA